MKVKEYGPPTSFVIGTNLAELFAFQLGGLNHWLFQHYLGGKGADYDLTREAVEKSLEPDIEKEHSDIVKKSERFKCPAIKFQFTSLVTKYIQFL